MAKRYYGNINISMRVCFETYSELSKNTVIDNVFPDGYDGEIQDTIYKDLKSEIVCDCCRRVITKANDLDGDDLCDDCFKTHNNS